MLGLQVHTALASLPCPLQQGSFPETLCLMKLRMTLKSGFSFFHLEGVGTQVWSPAKLWGVALENWESAPDSRSAPHHIFFARDLWCQEQCCLPWSEDTCAWPCTNALAVFFSYTPSLFLSWPFGDSLTM